MRTAIFTILLIIVLFLVEYFQLNISVHSKKWVMIGFFVFMAYVQNIFMSIGFKDNRKYFVQMSLSLTAVRFLFCLAFVGIYLYLGVEDHKSFVLTFFVLYLFYTFFEITENHRKLRHDSEK